MAYKHKRLISLNKDSISFALGLSSIIISIFSLIFSSTGLGLTSWYRGTNSDTTTVIAEANLFTVCFAPNVTQPIGSQSLTCTGYSSFSCSTSSYQNVIFNVTSYVAGCTNPISGSSAYISFDGPIYQLLIEEFYRLRAAAALSIVSILFIFFALILSFLTVVHLLNVYLAFVPTIIAFIAVVLGICTLVIAGSVFKYTGAGFGLFAVGILLELITVPLLSITASRIHSLANKIEKNEVEPIYERHESSPIFIRRIPRRKF